MKTFVITKEIFQQIDAIRGPVALYGVKRGRRFFIHAVREQGSGLPDDSLPQLGLLHQHADSPHLLTHSLTHSELAEAREALKKREEYITGILLHDAGGVALYPVYFSREVPNGQDMWWEYEGTTVRQQWSALESVAEHLRRRRRPRRERKKRARSS